MIPGGEEKGFETLGFTRRFLVQQFFLVAAGIMCDVGQWNRVENLKNVSVGA